MVKKTTWVWQWQPDEEGRIWVGDNMFITADTVITFPDGLKVTVVNTPEGFTFRLYSDEGETIRRESE